MSELALTVLNPQGNDPEQYFQDHAGEVSATDPAPVNYHAYAACVAGSCQRDVRRAIDLQKPVLMLIRHDLKVCFKALQQLKEAGLTAAVTLKETGHHQFHKLLGGERKIRQFREVVNLADGVVSPTQALLPVYRSLREGLPSETCQFIATPYPVNDPRWDFSVPIEERSGIYVGTRELKAASRNHLQCLILIKALATELDCPVGIVNSEGRRLERVLQSLDFPLRQTEVRTRMAYADYLRFTAKYRIVFQLDQSMVPGQVAGDCCMTRQIAVGGNGSLDQLVFPPFCGVGQDRDGVLNAARRLLEDDDYYRAAVREATEAAARLVSYERVAQELNSFYSSIRG
jgi:hypothetical protein